MLYIVLIGTPENRPPGPDNCENFFIVSEDKVNIDNIKVGYLPPRVFSKIKIKNFYSRAAFVFPSFPDNINDIESIEETFDLFDFTKPNPYEYPYQNVYDKIIAQMNKKLYHDFATWWIKKNNCK